MITHPCMFYFMYYVKYCLVLDLMPINSFSCDRGGKKFSLLLLTLLTHCQSIGLAFF